MAGRSITIRDVAKLAGVTASTVSRVLNNKMTTIPVTIETQRRVVDAANRLGYQPNRLARSLATAKTNVIGLYFAVPEPVGTSLHNEATWSGFGAMISGVQRVTQERGYEVHIFNRIEHEYGHPTQFRDVCPDFVDGLIYLEPNPRYDYFTRLAETGLPLVTIGPTPFSPPGYSVCADNRREMRDLVASLLRRGHRRIGYLLALVNDPPLDCIQRAEGYRGALEEAGIAFDPALVSFEHVIDIPIQEQTRRMLHLPVPPTVFIVGRPEVAAGVLAELDAAELRYPEDIELLFIGDDPAFRHMAPSVSAMGLCFFDLGRAAAQLVLDIIDGYEKTARKVTVPWEYMRRQSCDLSGGVFGGAATGRPRTQRRGATSRRSERR